LATCGSCATENPPQARFCLACGSPVGIAVESVRVRRLATVVFCDLVGSTALGDRLDPETLRTVMQAYYGAMRTAIERHGGLVEKFIGDAVVGVFGIPQTHEDDALRALRAAFEMRDAIPDLNARLGTYGVALQVRLGLQSGEVFSDDAAATFGAIAGDAFNVAARLQASAAAGEVVVGGAAARLLGPWAVLDDVPLLVVPGRDAPVTRFLATGLAPAAPGRGAALVGRGRPLRTLRQAFDEAVEDRACVLVTVLGPAGIGKTRLRTEFCEEVASEATVLVGQALPYGDGTTYAPIVEAIRMACGRHHLPPAETENRLRALLGDAPDADAVCERLLDMLGLGGGAATGETSWALRRLVERLAATRPVVLVFDDLHWAQEPLLELLDGLVDRVRAPVLLLCLARPDLLETRAAWGGGKARSASMTLEPLAAEPAAELAATLLGSATAPEMIERVTRSAEGNPLYLEQLAAMVRDGGPDELPIGIQALLAARVDRLVASDAALLSTASIQGREFDAATLATLSDAHPDECQARLVELELRGFVRTLDGVGERWAFAHGLLRDAAERRMAKLDRAQLHERLADALGAEPDADDELVGLHLERAVRLREELALPDDRTARLAERAGTYLARAGGRAFALIDLALAAALFERAAAMLPIASDARFDLIPDLAVALTESGRPGEAVTLLAEAIEAARGAGREVHALRATVQQQLARLYLGVTTAGEAESAGREAIAGLGRHGDRAGLAMAWVLMEYVGQIQGASDAAAESCLSAIEHARASGRLREHLQASGDLPQFLFIGLAAPATLRRAIERQDGATDAVSLATVDALQALIAGYAGDVTAFRAALARHDERLAERGLEFLQAAHDATLCLPIAMAYEPAEGVRRATAARDAMAARGDIWWVSGIDPILALVLHMAGRTDEACALTDRDPVGGVPDDLPARVEWQVATARSQLTRGRPEAAIATCRKALAGLPESGSGLLTALANEVLADALDMSGDARGGAAARAAARAVYEASEFAPGLVRTDSVQI
jgi:class 3 adenylate cyclase/predicted ATPase